MPQNAQVRDFSDRSQNVYPPGRVPERYETPQTAQSTAESYLGETGFLQLFSQERAIDTSSTHISQTREEDVGFDLPPPALQEGFAETYFEYCYPWCPVVERDDLDNLIGISQSPLLRNALALAGSQIQPPVMKHATPAAYYNRAKRLFYSSHEKSPITCIKAIILLYWWSPGAPNTVSMDTVWWWTGVAIRQAQQIGLHRESKPGQEMRGGVTQGLRRRIWWTLFVSIQLGLGPTPC